MKLTYLLVFLGCFSVNVFAQDNSTIPSTSIPRGDKNAPNTSNNSPQYSISKPFNPQRFKTPQKFAPISMDKPMQMKPQVSDLNVGKQYAEKMNKAIALKEGNNTDPKIFRRDMYFGEFVTESATISISYLDFGEVDADRVRVSVDGVVVAELIQLEGYEKRIFIGLLEDKINHIEIEAINEGVYSPNTGEFALIDEGGKTIVSDQWGLSTGFKATFKVRRVKKGTLLAADKK